MLTFFFLKEQQQKNRIKLEIKDCKKDPFISSLYLLSGLPNPSLKNDN